MHAFKLNLPTTSPLSYHRPISSREYKNQTRLNTRRQHSARSNYTPRECINRDVSSRNSVEENHSNPQSSSTEKSNILVAVRQRGLLKNELSIGGKNIIKVVDSKVVVLLDPGITANDDFLRINKSKQRQYAFDVVFDSKTTQEIVFEKTTKPLIDSVLEGFNATVFAYGATGAG
jgi:kinesin family protein 18/19